MPLSSPHSIRDGEEARGSCCPLPSCRLGVAAVCLLHTSSWFSISLLGEMVLKPQAAKLKIFWPIGEETLWFGTSLASWPCFIGGCCPLLGGLIRRNEASLSDGWALDQSLDEAGVQFLLLPSSSLFNVTSFCWLLGETAFSELKPYFPLCIWRVFLLTVLCWGKSTSLP